MNGVCLESGTDMERRGRAASDFIVDIINICVNYPPVGVGTNPKKTPQKK